VKTSSLVNKYIHTAHIETLLYLGVN